RTLEKHEWEPRDDDEILRLAHNAPNGEKFSRLFDDGDATGYPSQSEADMALCALLAYWTNGEPAQMDRLFCQSKLHRAKWDDKRGNTTYGQRTIQNAIDDWREKTREDTGGGRKEQPDTHKSASDTRAHDGSDAKPKADCAD